MKKIIALLFFSPLLLLALSEKDLRTQHWIETKINSEIQSLVSPILRLDQYSVAVSIELTPSEDTDFSLNDEQAVGGQTSSEFLPEDLSLGLIQARDMLEQNQMNMLEAQRRMRMQSMQASRDYEIQNATINFAFRSDVSPDSSKQVIQLAKSYVQSSFQVDPVVRTSQFSTEPIKDNKQEDAKTAAQDSSKNPSPGIKDKIYDIIALSIFLFSSLLFIYIIAQKLLKNPSSGATHPEVLPASPSLNNIQQASDVIVQDVEEITSEEVSVPATEDGSSGVVKSTDITAELKKEKILKVIFQRAEQVSSETLQSLLNYWMTQSDKDKIKVLQFFRYLDASGRHKPMLLEAPRNTFELVKHNLDGARMDISLLNEMLTEISVARYCGTQIFQKSSDFISNRDPSLIATLLHEISDNKQRAILYSVLTPESQRKVWAELTGQEKNILSQGIFDLPPRISQKHVIEALEICRKHPTHLEGGDFGPDSFSSKKTKSKFFQNLPLGTRMNLWDNIYLGSKEAAEEFFGENLNVAQLACFDVMFTTDFLKSLDQEESFALLSALSPEKSSKFLPEMGELFVAAWESQRQDMSEARSSLDRMSDSIDQKFVEFSRQKKPRWDTSGSEPELKLAV